MTRARAIDPCAMCSRFTTAGYDQQAAAGMGRCTGFDNDGEPEKFVPADAQPACVLFSRRKAEPTNQRRNRA
jgi:hypothetical protein